MKTEPELKRILAEAIQKNACSSQLNKFKQLIDEGNELEAWQTVLGNIELLKENNIELPENLEELAKHIGKIWHKNGQLCVQTAYKNGNLNGEYKE